ncbi:Plasma membrane proteolipid 3-like protein 1 [Phlyctema vagabunda]|uniref:Plasma membrane proteolipid 3-like protein 1 n=1 Tax=Phlyctema vagabunda TaxID=108571 RepID=A0ABR4PVE9_9HELO
MLGFIPGLLHAWYIIAKYPETDEYERVRGHDAEAGRVTYVIVQGHDGRQQRVPKSALRSAVPGQTGYGTTAPMAPPVHQDQNGTWNNNEAPATGPAHAGSSSAAAEGGSNAVPPSYAEAVKGDHKVQTRD